MKKQTSIALAAAIFLSVGLRVFQEHSEALSGEVISFVFALFSAILFGVIGYYKGYKKPSSLLLVRQERDGLKKQDAILVVLVVLLMLVPLIMYSAVDFKGADDQTTAMISTVRPDYEAWFKPFFEPSDEMEPWLFAIQAGGGSGAVCYILGKFRGLTGGGTIIA